MIPILKKSVPFLWASLLLALLASCQTATPTTTTPITLVQCRLTNGDRAQCGTLAVPENREAPNGRTLSLHILILPAKSSVPQPDPIFLLAGGPGQAASELYLPILAILGELNQERDIVLLDQRGTGQSHPLSCPELADAPLDTTDEEGLTLLETCRQALAQEADLTQYTTAVAMADLDEVRQALGYGQINLIGVSYGTRAAMTYLRTYPDQVRTMVLDAVVGPSLLLQYQLPRDGQQALDALFARCAADSACAARFPHFREEFDALYQSLRTPQEVAIIHPVTGRALTLTVDQEGFMMSVFNMLYSSDVLSLLPALVSQGAETRDVAPIVTLALTLAQSNGIYLGMHYAVTCTEDAPFIDLDEAQALQTGSEFPLTADTFLTACAHWPQGAPASALHEAFASDVPTLLLSGDADPITPPHYALEVAAQLRHSHHLVLPGQGHGQLFGGCMPSVIAAFIGAGQLDDLDTRCLDTLTPAPFFLDLTGPAP